MRAHTQCSRTDLKFQLRYYARYLVLLYKALHFRGRGGGKFECGKGMRSNLQRLTKKHNFTYFGARLLIYRKGIREFLETFKFSSGAYAMSHTKLKPNWFSCSEFWCYVENLQTGGGWGKGAVIKWKIYVKI